MMLKKGDCSSCTESPCRRVQSNTGSPVVLVNSARTMVSLSVSTGALWERNIQPPTINAIANVVAPVAALHRMADGELRGSDGREKRSDNNWARSFANR